MQIMQIFIQSSVIGLQLDRHKSYLWVIVKYEISFLYLSGRMFQAWSIY